MNIKKLLLTATASVLTVSSIIGCGAKVPPVIESEDRYVTSATPLAYKYSETEKANLASSGLFYDFDNESVGTKYQNEDEGSLASGIFSYRPKWSTFEIVSSEDGNALRYERGATSVQMSKDPHIDVEIKNAIAAREDFVAELDIWVENSDIALQLLQTIYRPSSGNIFGAAIYIENGALTMNDKKIADIPTGEFVKIACVMHQSEGTLDVYVNGYMVEYRLPYIKSSNVGHNPMQVRLVHSSEGSGVVFVDNVAVYKGSEPKYISKVSESDIKVVREYRFEGSEGEYKGENGLTLKPEKSTYNIIKTPDGRSVLKNVVKGADLMSLSTEGTEQIRCFTAEVYITSEDTDYTLAAFRGDTWSSVLEIRGTTLWNAIEEKAICELSVQKWAKIDLFIDGIKNICSVYVNGYRYVDGIEVSSSVLTKMDSIRIGATSTPDSEYTVYLDNVRLYNATGVLGYKGALPNGVETVYTVVSPADFSVINPATETELTITDEVKGSGEQTAKLSGFTSRYTIGLKNTGLTKQATGDYDLTDIDAIRIRYYSPKNAGRTFVLIFDCGNVYRDTKNGTCYYDGSWKKGSDGNYTCDKYPGVKAEQQWSYYHYMLTLDSEGWATVTIPVTAFVGNRLPDWSHVESIRLEAQGWNLSTNQNATTLLPDSKAEYYLDTVEIITYD